jgi:diguanylate cyclase (GGDEF)-like protein/PAS domain S-box-containing protein
MSVVPPPPHALPTGRFVVPLPSTRRARIAVAVVTALFYAVVFITLTYQMGATLGSLGSIPVLIAAWLFGRRGGSIAAIVTALFNITVVGLVGALTWVALLRIAGPGTIALLVVGLTVGWLRDLSQRLRDSRAALAASEARLRSQYQALPLPTYTWQRAGDTFILADYNAAAVAFTKGGIISLRGASHRDLYSDLYRDDPDYAAYLERCHAEGAIVRRELRFRLATTGEKKELALTYVPSPPDLVLLYAEDISERKAAEAALRASEASLAAALRIAQLGSWEYDFDSKVLRWSDEVFRIAGHAPKAFVPTFERMMALVHDDDRERIERAITASLERGEPYDLEHRIMRLDRTVRTVRQQTEVVRDSGGRPIRWLGIALDITEQRELEARLQHQANHDTLTGLPNRALLVDRLDQALSRARRGGVPCAVFFLDLDRFKEINDSLGHSSGDRLLVAAADRLRRCLREGDTLARLGGDEFAVLIENVAEPTEAANLAKRFIRALGVGLVLNGQTHRIAASIGIVLSTPMHTRPDDLLRDADVAMYRAKGAGGSNYALFDPGMQAQLAERAAMERDLRGALDRSEFAVHYQPIIDLASGDIVEAEALVRWRHPVRGAVPPDRFIPVAEETGLIVPLGRWVLRTACRQAREWNSLGHALTVSVNLSAREFQDPALAVDVAHILAGTRLPANRLRLEITERLAMRDAVATTATLVALRELGVQVAIDDFGTGYSSLAYLKRFPVDVLKVDRAFVSGLGTNPEDTAIVGAMIGLGRTLGLAVTAEGVETADQVANLRALGCTSAQGFYFARPLDAEALGTLLEEDPIPALPSPLAPPVPPSTAEFRHRRAARAQIALLPTVGN